MAARSCDGSAGGVCSNDELLGHARVRQTTARLRRVAAIAFVAAGCFAFLSVRGKRQLRWRGDVWWKESLSAAERPATTFRAVIRDFKDTHPDFQPTYPYQGVITQGLVQTALGPDDKPAFNGCEDGGSNGCPLSTPENFNQWFNTVEGVNIEINKEFVVESKENDDAGNPVFRYEVSNFFPINGEGWRDVHKWVDNNFYFTMEIMHLFVYHGGEYFRFRGDDDVWVFFNGKLGLDIGGMHPQEQDIVELDEKAEELGLEIGNSVTMHIFFAERCCCNSNFKIETNIQLAEDPCAEYDHINVREVPTNVLQWSGTALRASDDVGKDVSIIFQCIDGACGADQRRGFKGGFPAIIVPANSFLALTLEVTDFDLEELSLTFWDLETGKSVEVLGGSEQTLMKETNVSYTKVGHKDIFAGRAPSEDGDEPMIPSRLTQEHKNKAVTIKLTDLIATEITLKNDGAADAVFQFSLAPHLVCIPCSPACAETNEPLVHTQTTTVTTTTSTITSHRDSEATAASTKGNSDYKCCLAGFTAFGREVIVPPCYEEKTALLFPWCPDQTSATTNSTAPPMPTGTTTSDNQDAVYKCCLAGFTVPLWGKEVMVPPCYDDKKVFFPWCP